MTMDMGNQSGARSRRDRPQSRNLQRRLPAPAKGNGRLQRQMARAFAVHGPVVSSSQLYDWCFACDGRRADSQAMRWSVLLDATCERVGRAPTIGRPWLWQLRKKLVPQLPEQSVHMCTVAKVMADP
jgi:hypothetical protein